MKSGSEVVISSVRVIYQGWVGNWWPRLLVNPIPFVIWTTIELKTWMGNYRPRCFVYVITLDIINQTPDILTWVKWVKLATGVYIWSIYPVTIYAYVELPFINWFRSYLSFSSFPFGTCHWGMTSGQQCTCQTGNHCCRPIHTAYPLFVITHLINYPIDALDEIRNIFEMLHRGLKSLNHVVLSAGELKANSTHIIPEIRLHYAMSGQLTWCKLPCTLQ